MRAQERLTRPALVPLPTEIDIAAEHVGERLRASFTPSVAAEMGFTVFCCTFGSSHLASADEPAPASPASAFREVNY